jgi:hypothetical protein
VLVHAEKAIISLVVRHAEMTVVSVRSPVPWHRRDGVDSAVPYDR